MALCGRVVLPSCANDLPSPTLGEVYYNTTNSTIRVYGSNVWYEWESISCTNSTTIATGGTATCNGDGYVCHTFTTSDTLTLGLNTNIPCAYVYLINGGGGGGYNVGGGGGGAHVGFSIGHTVGTACAWIGPLCLGYDCASTITVEVGAAGAGGNSTSPHGGSGGFSCVSGFRIAPAPTTYLGLPVGFLRDLRSFYNCYFGGAGYGNGDGFINGQNGGGAGPSSVPPTYPNGGYGIGSGTSQNRTSAGGGNWGWDNQPTLCTNLNAPSSYVGGTGSCGYTHPDLGYVMGGGGAGSTHLGHTVFPPNPFAPPVDYRACNDARRTCVYGGGCGGRGCWPTGTGGPAICGGNASGYGNGGGGGGGGGYNGGSGTAGIVVIKYCCQ